MCISDPFVVEMRRTISYLSLVFFLLKTNKKWKVRYALNVTVPIINVIIIIISGGEYRPREGVNHI